MTTPHDHIRIEGCYRCVLPEDDPAFIMSETKVYNRIRDLAKQAAYEKARADRLQTTCEELRAEVKELEELVDHQLEVMNDGTLGAALVLDENRELKEEIERLKAKIHTPTCACQLCIQAYGPVGSR